MILSKFCSTVLKVVNVAFVIAAPPKEFDPDMSDDDFLLFLNMYGTPYELCNAIILGKR